MTWFTQHDPSLEEQAELASLAAAPARSARASLASAPAPGLRRWTVILSDGSELAVEAERMCRAPDDTLLALSNDPRLGYPTGARMVSMKGRWFLFRQHEIRVAKMARVARSAKKPKHSEAEAELRTHQEQMEPPRGAAMYGRVLKEHAEFASGKDDRLYVYESGVYVPARSYVGARLQDLADDRWSRHLRNETVAWLLENVPGLEDSLGPNIINVRNGLLMWEGGRWRLRGHDPELRTTMQLPIKFDPDAECPVYDRLLETSIPDEATRKFLDEWSGNNLTSDYRHQKALMLGGKEGSGKSQYLYVLGRALGPDNVEARMLQSFGEKFAAACLYGKLANICADISSHELRMTGMFKSLTGGDLISAEMKNVQEPRKFYNAAKLSFSANEIPVTRDATQAFFDRWFVVKFPRKFRGTDAQEEDLGITISNNPTEMSGVLNRALAGLTRLRKQGHFTIGDSMSDAHDEFRQAADTVAMFIADYASRTDHREREKREYIYQSYKAWCDANGHQTLGSNRFYTRLREWTPTKGVSVQHAPSKGFEYFTVRSIADEG
jgi:putative DNA primase/helicase